MQLKSIYILLLSVSVLASCGRTTSSSEKEENSTTAEIDITQPIIKDKTLITPEEPFKNQPNEFCTVIRKLDASYYATGQTIEDVNAFPKKYCLLDVCLEIVNPNGMVINLGDDDEVVTTSFELIKVFETEAEAKSYVEQYKIVDFKWE